MEQTKKYQLNWRGIDIEIEYLRSYSNAFEEVYGYPLAQIQLRSEFPLPITETGSLSRFIPDAEKDLQEHLVSDIENWLNEEAQKQKWQPEIQLSLF